MKECNNIFIWHNKDFIENDTIKSCSFLKKWYIIKNIKMTNELSIFGCVYYLEVY